jgi:hypothetical protein
MIETELESVVATVDYDLPHKEVVAFLPIEGTTELLRNPVWCIFWPRKFAPKGKQEVEVVFYYHEDGGSMPKVLQQMRSSNLRPAVFCEFATVLEKMPEPTEKIVCFGSLWRPNSSYAFLALRDGRLELCSVKTVLQETICIPAILKRDDDRLNSVPMTM